MLPETLAEFHIACELRGATMSSLVHQHVTQIIREEKAREPEKFTAKNLTVVMKQIAARGQLKRKG